MLPTPQGKAESAAASASVSRRALVALAAVPLQVFWCVRATIVPGMAALGAALIFANCDNALGERDVGFSL